MQHWLPPVPLQEKAVTLVAPRIPMTLQLQLSTTSSNDPTHMNSDAPGSHTAKATPALKALVVGAGYFAQFHLRAWQRVSNVTLAEIVEIDTSKHLALQQQYPQVRIITDLADASADIDIVDISTPPATHATLIDKALHHTNALIVCQKPFCNSLAEAHSLARRVAEENRTLAVHENFRFQPWYGRIKALLDQQFIGELQQATFRLRPGDGQGPDAYLQRQPYFQSMPRFLIHETGIHFIDVFRFLFGEPDSVSADLRRLNPAIAGEDAGYFTLRYQSGFRALFDGNRHLDHAADNPRLTLGEMLIEGTGGSLALNGSGQLTHREFGSTQINEIECHFNDIDFGGDCVFRLQSHIADHLINRTPLHNSATDYLLNLELESRVYEASEKQCTIAVNHRA
jgi:predicted dehydrogenase